MTDKPVRRWRILSTFKYVDEAQISELGGEIAENLHFLISRMSAAVHRALCRIFAAVVATSSGWKEIRDSVARNPVSAPAPTEVMSWGGFRIIDRLKS